MLGHESRNEIVRVVVALLQTDRSRHARPLHRLLQQVGLELFGQEPVRRALIDQQVGQARTRVNQRAGVIFPPRRPVRPEIAGQRLVAQGRCIGLTIGANALTERNRPGLRKAIVSAPWPPIE